ncbi:uncharacterized protein LOC129574190 isoform X2 [Sitodiplosis mosellana]|uniref:uncharacterized protein LOC129574190 isoform X2 n=1 Tax=Sitodiplosis mosellana TaxID=263140 RepID=UPI0024441882|nr:uncharacterized protein LOC129574190 isoform X2 [Sitodiplosis mosellana]
MKLLTFGLLKLHSGRLRICMCQRPFVSIAKQSSTELKYIYSINELLENVSVSTKSVWSSFDASNEFQLKDLLDSDPHYRSIISSVILAKKCGRLGNPTEDNTSHPFFEHLCDSIKEMTADDVVSTLVALNFLNVPLHHTINRELIIRVTNMLKDLDDFPLKSLSNLAIFSQQNDDRVYPYLLCADSNSHMIKYLKNCDNFQDLYYITLYFESLDRFLTKELMTMHKAKMKAYLKDLDPQINFKELLTMLTFYRKHMSFKNSRIIRNILLFVCVEIPNLSNSDLQNIAWTRDVINEPASIIPEIVKAAESRTDKSTDLDLIYCRLSKYLPDHLESVSRDMLTILANSGSENTIKNDQLFAILKHKRYISVKDIYKKYWEKMTEDLANISTQALDIDFTLSTLSYRYCLLQKGLASRYRCQKFESLLKELVLIEVKYGISAWLPHRIANMATFIIGYANDPIFDQITLPEYFVKKIEEMAPQFTANEIIDISIGIETFHRNGIPKSVNRRMAAKVIDRIGRLENVVDACIERMIDGRRTIQIDSICLLIRAYANQKVLKKTHTLDKLIRKLEEICSSDDVIITARTIQIVTSSLNKIVFVVPRLCEHMLKFVNEHRDIVGGDTVAYLLFYLFSMGYEPYVNSQPILNEDKTGTPKSQYLNAELFDFDNFTRIINRDFELMPAWLVVQACLAFSFYQVLTLDLISRVFNIDFVTRLEKELALMYDARSYPKNLLNIVMQLNRAVCLDYPEAGVPWFQQNFAQLAAAEKNGQSSPYFNDIYKMLLSYVGGDQNMIRTNHLTPYGYRIPFVIYFNSHKQLVYPPFDEGSQSLNKVAIIPLLNHSFRLNDTKALRGFNRLQARHLSILGYDVVQICYREWNSIHMNLPGAREIFLRNFLNKYNPLIE